MQDSFAEIPPAASGGRVQRMFGGMARIVGAILSVALVVAIAYWAFKLGQRDAAELPVIKAQQGEARIRPENPGGAEIDNQGLAVNEVLARSEPTAVETTAELAPEPETIPPAPEPVAEPEPATATAVEVTPATPISEQPLLSELPTENGATEDAVSPDALLDDLVASVLSESDNPAPVVDMERPARRGEMLASTPAEPEADAETETAPAENTGIVEAAVPLTLVQTGDRLIQLGIFSSEDEANAEWVRLREEHADLLGDKELYIERRETGARVFYRLRVLPFESLDDARGICTALVGRDEQCIAVTAR